MFCMSCGKDNLDALNFCFSCGTALSPLRSSSAAANAANAIEIERAFNGHQQPVRPGVVSLLAVLQFISGVLFALLMLHLLVVIPLTTPSQFRAWEALPSLLVGLVGALQMRCGFGLWNLKSYGRTIQLVFSCIGLIGFPFGTIVSILVLVYLNKAAVKILFSEKLRGQLTEEEARQLAVVGQGSTWAR